jgi:ATP-dependent DNA helicase RecG
MDLSSLKEFLQAGEWNDIEFKRTRQEYSKSALDTVSAFANTSGGWLVFGVAEHPNGEYELLGVEKPDEVQNNFLSVLRNGTKFNQEITVSESRRSIDGRTVLLFHIAENARNRKPVYLDGDPRRTFLRRGSGDYKARPHELARLLRDAHEDRWDGQAFDRVPLKDAFDGGTLKWYRDRFKQVNTAAVLGKTNHEFLYRRGFLLKDGGTFLPTRGAVMLFGSPLAIHQLLPRPTLDVQFLGYGRLDPRPDTTLWLDRLVCEENLLRTWDQLYSKYRFYMPKPFRDIDPETLARRDDPPSFRVFREAAVNLLIHQDYGDHTRKAVIKFFRDGFGFWNPGDVFGDDSNLWEPGEKEARNPSLARAFRHISMCEQAGTGLHMMREVWPKLGHPLPDYRNDRAGKSFELFLPGLDHEVGQAASLLNNVSGAGPVVIDANSNSADAKSIDPVTFQARLQALVDKINAQLEEAHHYEFQELLDLQDQLQALANESKDQLEEVLKLLKLTDQEFLKSQLSKLAEVLAAKVAQVEAQVAQVKVKVAQVKLLPWQVEVLAACREEPQTTWDLLTVAGYKSRAGTFKKGLKNLLEQRFLELTIPDRPNSRLQKYRLTDRGRQILAQISSGES